MTIPLDILIFRLFLVLLIGGLIGAEREYRSKSAGFRTIILICLGSFLFSIFSIYVSAASPDRIAANVVTGIGFLGAGVIFRADRKISGITTAATIWATAALGMGIAFGYYQIVFAGTVLLMASLFMFTKLEVIIDKLNLYRSYTIVSVYDIELSGRYEKIMKECNLHFKKTGESKKDQYITATWAVNGKEKNHNKFVEMILHDETIKEFEY